MTDTLEIFREARTFQGSLMDLHPLKLDRWHRGLVGLPDAVYMQYGCPPLYEHVGTALEAIKAMVDMLGANNLPVDPQEIARRRIGSFSWHTATSSSETGTSRCTITWNQDATTWEVTCDLVPGTKKMVSSFLTGIEVGTKWVADHSEKDVGVEDGEPAP